MKQKLKEHKGITLVALILTIIVLLILAVVAISAVKGDGIISHAKNARSQYSGAQKNEQELLSNYELMLAQETGNAWKQEKTKVTKGDQILNVGDYVNYVSGVEGYADTNGWRILGEENGQILLISTSVGKVELSGAADFYNDVGIGKLNKVCLPYGQGDGAAGARSIKAEDINRITGFIKEKYDEGEVSGYGNKVIYTLQDTDTLISTVEGKPLISSSFQLSRGPGKFIKLNGEELKVGESYVFGQNTDYFYYPKKGVDITDEIYEMLFGGVKDNFYWLATSVVSGSIASLSIGMKMCSDTGISSIPLLSSVGENKQTYNVRAVVSLKSDVKLTETSAGSGEWNIS